VIASVAAAFDDYARASTWLGEQLDVAGTACLANLDPDPREAGTLTAIEHVLALRLHRVRVEAVMHDPAASLRFEPRGGCKAWS